MPIPASGGAKITGAAKAIRFAYYGCTNRPFLRLVVIDKKLYKQKQCIEQLGTYDPMPNVHGEQLCSLNLERLLYWMGKKAHISDGVARVLGLSGLLPIHPHIYINGWKARQKMREEAAAAEAGEEKQKEEAS